MLCRIIPIPLHGTGIRQRVVELKAHLDKLRLDGFSKATEVMRIGDQARGMLQGWRFGFLVLPVERLRF